MKPNAAGRVSVAGDGASPRYAARRSKQLREAKSSSEKRNDVALQRWSLFDHLGENISTLLNYLRRFIFLNCLPFFFSSLKSRDGQTPDEPCLQSP